MDPLQQVRVEVRTTSGGSWQTIGSPGALFGHHRDEAFCADVEGRLGPFEVGEAADDPALLQRVLDGLRTL